METMILLDLSQIWLDYLLSMHRQQLVPPRPVVLRLFDGRSLKLTLVSQGIATRKQAAD